MERKSRFISFIFLISLLVLTGCATSRSVVSINTPKLEHSTISNNKSVYIEAVNDQRVFEVAPKQPSIPSLDSSEESGAAITSRAIARKRNTFGAGLGDILLQEGQTVELLISKCLIEAFEVKGYKIVTSKEQIDRNTYLVTAHINKFWSWMNPGFWAITLSTEIATDIHIQSSGKKWQTNIFTSASDTFQTGVDGNWLEVMNSALKNYVNKVALQID